MRHIIGSVIVSYYPNSETFIKVITSTLEQVDCLVVVNNGKNALSYLTESLPSSLAGKFNLIENNDNLGVATALNYGIKFLINNGCSHFILLDQDSFLPKKMLATLYDTYIQLTLDGVKLAAVGPTFFDTRLEKLSPFIRFKNNGFELVFASDVEPVIPVHLLITSGTFMSTEVIKDVGLMEEGLFIDYVDNEWCLRAISKGYKIVADGRVRMEHSIGDEAVVLLNRKHHMHSPLRHYYITRNSTHLFKRRYIPFNWRLSMLMIAIKLFVFYSLFTPGRLENSRMMIKGFYHGAIGKFGRYDTM